MQVKQQTTKETEDDSYWNKTSNNFFHVGMSANKVLKINLIKFLSFLNSFFIY